MSENHPKLETYALAKKESENGIRPSARYIAEVLQIAGYEQAELIKKLINIGLGWSAKKPISARTWFRRRFSDEREEALPKGIEEEALGGAASVHGFQVKLEMPVIFNEQVVNNAVTGIRQATQSNDQALRRIFAEGKFKYDFESRLSSPKKIKAWEEHLEATRDLRSNAHHDWELGFSAKTGKFLRKKEALETINVGRATEVKEKRGGAFEVITINKKDLEQERGVELVSERSLVARVILVTDGNKLTDIEFWLHHNAADEEQAARLAETILSNIDVKGTLDGLDVSRAEALRYLNTVDGGALSQVKVSTRFSKNEESLHRKATQSFGKNFRLLPANFLLQGLLALKNLPTGYLCVQANMARDETTQTPISGALQMIIIPALMNRTREIVSRLMDSNKFINDQTTAQEIIGFAKKSHLDFRSQLLEWNNKISDEIKRAKQGRSSLAEIDTYIKRGLKTGLEFVFRSQARAITHAEAQISKVKHVNKRLKGVFVTALNLSVDSAIGDMGCEDGEVVTLVLRSRFSRQEFNNIVRSFNEKNHIDPTTDYQPGLKREIVKEFARQEALKQMNLYRWHLAVQALLLVENNLSLEDIAGKAELYELANQVFIDLRNSRINELRG